MTKEDKPMPLLSLINRTEVDFETFLFAFEFLNRSTQQTLLLAGIPRKALNLLDGMTMLLPQLIHLPFQQRMAIGLRLFAIGELLEREEFSQWLLPDEDDKGTKYIDEALLYAVSQARFTNEDRFDLTHVIELASDYSTKESRNVQDKNGQA